MNVQSSNLFGDRVYRCAMRYISALLCVLPLALCAQHCGYDFTSIIVVRPHAYGDTAVIDGLRITLLEKDNLPATSTGEPYQLFTRNTVRSGLIHPRTFRKQDGRVFPFAQDNYILVVPNHWNMDNYNLLVQDERPGRDGPRYRQQVMHLHVSQSRSLCGRYDDEVYPVPAGEPAFAPIDITLFLR